MLHGALLGSESDIAKTIQLIAEIDPFVRFDSIFTALPPYRDLQLLVNRLPLDFVMIDCENAEQGLKTASTLREFAPQVGLIGFRCSNPQFGRDLDLIPMVRLSESEALSAIQSSIKAADKTVFSNVRAFLPGKAGVGASTVALNAAGCLVETGYARRVLLVEADLRSGVLGTLLNIKPKRSIDEILHNADSLDSTIWERCVTRKHGIDVMLTRRDEPVHLPQWFDYLHFLRHVSSRYDYVLLDLPEVINGATLEAVRRASYTCIVTTPEFPCLDLSRARIEQLKKKVIQPECLKVIVNRWQRTDPPPNDIAVMLGAGIETALPNDYASVRAAIMDGRLVASNTRLGKAFRAYANFIACRASQIEADQGTGLRRLLSATGPFRQAFALRGSFWKQ